MFLYRKIPFLVGLFSGWGVLLEGVSRFKIRSAYILKGILLLKMTRLKWVYCAMQSNETQGYLTTAR